MRSYYDDPTIWKTFENELLDIVDHVRAHGARPIFVTFPVLTNVEASRPYVAKVVGFLRGKNVPVLDLTAVLAGREPSDLIVNSLDEHPNESVHREIAELLLDESAAYSIRQD